MTPRMLAGFLRHFNHNREQYRIVMADPDRTPVTTFIVDDERRELAVATKKKDEDRP